MNVLFFFFSESEAGVFYESEYSRNANPVVSSRLRIVSDILFLRNALNFVYAARLLILVTDPRSKVKDIFTWNKGEFIINPGSSRVTAFCPE